MPPAVKKDGPCTYQDYLTWPDDERWEIIEGVAYDMSPAPAIRHQRVSMELESRLRSHLSLSGSPCEMFHAPADVVFDEHNVVQPDIFVVCDEQKITERSIQGAPDVVIEILSPSTTVKDRREKKRIYERFGVLEYLLVHPGEDYVEAYRLEGAAYGPPAIHDWDETLAISHLGIDLPLWEVFGRELPDGGEPPVEQPGT